jgi:hydrophobic/amphiphilic exporter-1 (mainly G- bacteria), HAE1 family
MNPSSPFIKRPVMTTILMATILLLGLFAFRKLPVTDLPNVDYPMISVHAVYAGAGPEVMAKMVATPIEKELVAIPGVKHVFSQNSRGFSWIMVQFHLDQNMDKATQEVQSALKRSENSLPADLDHLPTYSKANGNQESILYLVLTSPSSSLAELYEYAHTRIEQRIARIDGVGKVEVHGSPYAVRIELNPELMAARHVTFEEVRHAISQATNNVPLGILDTPGRKFTLEVPHSFQNAADFSEFLILPDIRLKEIAIVRDGLDSEEVFHYLTKDQNSFAVILGIQKQAGANTVKISQELQRILPELQDELPKAMQLELWFDKANWIKEAIEDVEWSLILAFALVVVVVFLSLGRMRETLVAATALPLSIIGTFLVMHWLHFNIDLLSMLALTLAMGFVIDDAIVVLENIVRHQEKGLSAWEAALIGSKQISFTVLSMTLSLVAIFIPLLFMPGVIGNLFREFSITLAVSILVSGFVSLTLTPMLCSKFLSSHEKKPSKLTISLLGLYERSLDFCLRWKKTVLVLALSCIALCVLTFRMLSIDLFPQEDRGFIWSYVQIPSGLPKTDSENYQEKLNKIIQKNPAVDSLVNLNFKDYLVYLIRLTPSASRPSQAAVVAELQSQLNAIPGTQAFMRGIQLISSGMEGQATSNYQFVMRGTDLEEVKKAAEALKQKLSSHPSFVNPNLSLKADNPKLEVQIFEERAKKLGFTRQAIQSLLQNAYAGGSIGKITKSSEQYNVFLELAPRFQKNTEALSKLYLKTATGETIPLKALASWKEGVGLQTIEHLDTLPAANLYFDIAKEASLAGTLEELKKMAQQILPPSVSGTLEGMAEMVDDTRSDTIEILLLAVLAMYVILGILYESFIHPLTILSSLPFACLGGILTLLTFHESLSLYSMVGFLLLIGIVKKNGIMMVDYALEQQRHFNRDVLSAVKEACLVRFRPIMMTTFAAIMGAVPIAIGIGAGSETRRGLGLVIVGGLVFAQLLTLYVTPILYFYLDKLRRKQKSLDFGS